MPTSFIIVWVGLVVVVVHAHVGYDLSCCLNPLFGPGP
jgi:hypothetical protein